MSRRSSKVWSRMTSVWTRKALATLVAIATGLVLLAVGGGSADRAAIGRDSRATQVAEQVALLKSNSPPRWRAIALAETKRGRPYCWGGNGPSCYDCSGLVAWAYGRVGFHFGRTVANMVASGHLARTSRPKWGDLVVWRGNGHIEFYSSSRYTFGEHHSGTTASFRPYWGSYTFYHVK